MLTTYKTHVVRQEDEKETIAGCQAPLSDCLLHPGHTCDFVSIMSQPLHMHTMHIQVFILVRENEIEVL